MRQILHIDMDAFFASVEQRDDPRLRGKPVLVGGRSRRSVVAAASYEARKFGARSAMPMGEALRLCPHAIIVEPSRGKYEEASHAVFEIFRRYTPLVEGLSVDEAFLDVTASRSLFGDGVAIATAIKNDIERETHLTGSAGVAPNKFAAKIASDMNKPNGLTIVPDDVRAFLAPLPLERMWGVGPKTAERLRAMGYRTIGDLAEARGIDLEIALGAWGEVVRQLARGQDDREVDPRGVAKSIGSEETYEKDLHTKDEISVRLLDQSSKVAQRLVSEGISARTIVVKLKYSDFSVRTRRKSLPDPVMDTSSIHEAARALLVGFPLDLGVRLTGVTAASLVFGPPPEKLFDDGASKRRKIEEVARTIKDRFESPLLTRASLLDLDDERRVNFESPKLKR